MSTLSEPIVRPHPKHTANRVEKARRLLAWIDAHEMFANDWYAVETVAAFGPGTWRLISQASGEDEPSNVTVGIILGLLVERVGS